MNTQNILHNQRSILDVVLDSSQYYDFELADNSIDYISYETYPVLESYVLTEDGFILITEDNINLIY